MAQVDLRYRPFLILLGLGVLVRAVLMILYFPSVMLWVDAIRHTRIIPAEIFGDPWMPAGYAMWLAVLRGITHQLWFTIVVQHFMGLAVGPMIFLVIRRLGAMPCIACLGAAVPLLSGDHLYLEHIIMSDSLLIFLTSAGLSAAVFAFVERVNLAWLCVASVFFGMATLVRNVGAILLPVLVLVTFFCVRKSSSRRILAVLLASLLPALAVVGSYCLARTLVHGAYLGFADMRGWNLYARVAPFADCGRFSPPEGTAVLCENTPPEKRPASFGYTWDVNSVARRNFPYWPPTDKLNAFALEVIKHQPLDYCSAVLFDFVRYFEPSIGSDRWYAGIPRETMSFGWRDLSVERVVVHELSKKYHKTKAHLHGEKWLAVYQNLFRVGGLALIALLMLTCVGMIRARGPMRPAIFLFGLIGLGLYLMPVMALSYDFRYGIPAETFVVVSGLLGAMAWSRSGTEYSA